VTGVEAALQDVLEGLSDELRSEAGSLLESLHGSPGVLLLAEPSEALVEALGERWLEAFELEVLKQLRACGLDAAVRSASLPVDALTGALTYACEVSDEKWLSTRSTRLLEAFWTTSAPGLYRVPARLAALWFLPDETSSTTKRSAPVLEVAKRLFDDRAGSLTECLDLAAALEE
jgi:hypothetical protein